MKTIYIQYFQTSFGELILGSYQDMLCLCDWRHRKMRAEIDQRIQKGLDAMYIEAGSPLLLRTVQELSEYFSGQREHFNLPLHWVGTAFQQRVWSELLKIPYGKTETYLGLSRKLGDEKAIRAVAAANGANALSIIVPCHRIIGSRGELTGYAGGLQTKQKLLELEGWGANQMRLFR